MGEDVYAIGAPQDYRKMQDTVTKGIVSAHRSAMKFMGTRQNFIQSDVELHPGNSGGPVLDGNGNIIGIAVGAQKDADGDGMGLNWFIPIDEALGKMNIELTDGKTEAPVDILKK